MKENLLNKIQVEWKESLNQQDLFTRHHKRYDVKITYNGKYYCTEYQCNPTIKNNMKKDIIYCVWSDSNCYEYAQNIDDFQAELGYTLASELLNAYNGCRKANEKIHELFNNEELEELDNIFQDY